MGLFRHVAIVLAMLVSEPAMAQDTPLVPSRMVKAAPSPWRDLPQILMTERAAATCSIGAILGMGAALLTSIVDIGVAFSAELLFGGALVGCGAWLGEIAAEQFQWRWEQEHGEFGSTSGEAVRREKASGPAQP
jgi:hypothetical protein